MKKIKWNLYKWKMSLKLMKRPKSQLDTIEEKISNLEFRPRKRSLRSQNRSRNEK